MGSVRHSSYKERHDDRVASGRIGFWGWFAWLFILSMGFSNIHTYGILLIIAAALILVVIIKKKINYYSGKTTTQAQQAQRTQAQLVQAQLAQLAPPGWYTDPWQQAELRYWDGNDWTYHTTPQGEGDAV
jgi:hypothetical protein